MQKLLIPLFVLTVLAGCQSPNIQGLEKATFDGRETAIIPASQS